MEFDKLCRNHSIITKIFFFPIDRIFIMDFFCDFCEDHISASSQVCTECGEPLVDNPEIDWEDDGQPDEAQEWYDFDPDC